jgi:hypothetical protein
MALETLPIALRSSSIFALLLVGVGRLVGLQQVQQQMMWRQWRRRSMASTKSIQICVE